jgi:hypothetical protein
MCEYVKIGDGVTIVCGGHRRPKKPVADLQFPATRLQLQAARYRYMYFRPCKRCGVEIEFWLTPSKKWAPLERMKDDPEHRRISHFSTCPFANEFRRTDAQGKLFT